MGAPISGEIIGAFCGLAIVTPFIYQIQSQLLTPTKSALPRRCWLLVAVGVFGIAAFFMLVPRAPSDKSFIGAPESPRTIGWFALGASLASQFIAALDSVAPSTSYDKKVSHLIKVLLPSYAATIGAMVALYFVHGHLIKSRPFTRDFLALFASVLSLFQLAGMVISGFELTVSQIAKPGPEVAGLHWMPVLMQALGYFTAIILSTLLYSYPDWFGVGILAWYLVIDIVFIAITAWRGRSGSYSRLPT